MIEIMFHNQAIRQCGKLTDLSTGLTYFSEEISRGVAQRSDDLKEAGVTGKSIVLMQNNNSAQFFIDLFSVWNCGGIPAPISEALTEWEMENTILSLTPAAIINQSGVVKKVRNKAEFQLPGDTVLILQSSGTTGQSKSVFITAEHLQFQINTINKYIGESIKNILCILPTNFGHGLIANCLAGWMSGKDLFISPKFDLQVALNLHNVIEKHKIHYFSSIPSYWSILSETGRLIPFSKDLKRIDCASSMLSNSLFKKIRQTINQDFYINYGMTELGSWISSYKTPLNSSEYIEGNVGKTLSDAVELITDKDAVVISHKFKIFTKPVNGDIREVNPIFVSGDCGYVKNSELILTGRLSDFINRAGEKISPYEVEEVFSKIPGISKCVAFAMPDTMLGESVAVAIQLQDNAQTSVEKLIKEAESKLSTAKIPSQIYFVKSFPLTTNGKISRKQLADQFKK